MYRTAGSAGSTGTHPSPSSYSEKAVAGVQALQHWYSPSFCVYASPAGWWNSANAVTVVTNYTVATGDTQYVTALSQTLANAPSSQGHVNFTNNY